VKFLEPKRRIQIIRSGCSVIESFSNEATTIPKIKADKCRLAFLRQKGE